MPNTFYFENTQRLTFSNCSVIRPWMRKRNSFLNSNSDKKNSILSRMKSRKRFYFPTTFQFAAASWDCNNPKKNWGDGFKMKESRLKMKNFILSSSRCTVIGICVSLPYHNQTIAFPLIFDPMTQRFQNDVKFNCTTQTPNNVYIIIHSYSTVVHQGHNRLLYIRKNIFFK